MPETLETKWVAWEEGLAHSGNYALEHGALWMVMLNIKQVRNAVWDRSAEQFRYINQAVMIPNDEIAFIAPYPELPEKKERKFVEPQWSTPHNFSCPACTARLTVIGVVRTNPTG